MKVRWFFEGAGSAIVLLIVYFWTFLSPYHLVIYHAPRPVSTIAGGLALDLLAACLLCSVVFAFMDHFDLQQKSIVWAGILVYFVARITSTVIFFLNFYNTEILIDRKMRVIIRVAAFGAALALWWFSRVSFQKCVRGVRTVLALVGCCILWMLPQLVFIAIRTSPKTITAFSKTVPQNAPASSDRIVWILFDELSYDQAFDGRQYGIDLPRFDQLKNQSISFQNVQPAGYYTDRIIPSLFLGRTVDDIRSSLQGDLYIRSTRASHWERFDPNATLFKNAQRLGWSTGVAGWFNPYCRILQNVLDSCYWQSIDPLLLNFSDQKSTLANALILPVESIFPRRVSASVKAVSIYGAHTREYNDVMKASVSLIKDESIRFVFIHLPVPHPPGIYDRKTNTFREHGTYLDNLVLADRALGTLLDTLEKTSAASHTTLVVSSDHSWRVDLWRSEAGWNKEEERASGGHFDPRPVLLIRFPVETTPETKATSFDEIKTSAMIDAMLQGDMRTQADLSRWLGTH